MTRARLRRCAGAAIALGGAALIAAGHIAQEAFARAALVAPRATMIVYDRNGAFLTQIGHAQGARVEYGYWPLKTIPERLARATLALEDRRFHDHDGVDARAILRALWKNVARRGANEGASTIAMQIARMQNPGPRTLARKAMEAVTAIAILRRNGREATLAHYLRLAPYGSGAHGAAHAARLFFDKPLADLSWAETALLAALPQSPGRMTLSHASGLSRAVARARRAIDQLARTQALDAAQAELAKRELAALRPVAPLRRPEALHLALRYERLAREGRIAPIAEDDPRIHATVDLTIEDDISRLARRYLANFRRAGARQAAAMAMDRETGEVLAEIGSADYRDARGGAYDFTRVARSPGSTLKPFVYALAFERGALKATDLLADIPEGASGVSNADGAFLGLTPPRQALANSRNIPATNLLRRVGLDANFRFLHDIGLHDLDAPAESFGISMAIGSLPTRLEHLMRAYDMLANDGVLRDPTFAREEARRAPRRALSLDTARLITSMLADPQARLPSFPRYGPLEYPFAVAVKTGTSQGYRDAWTLCYSRKFVVGVWLGRADAGAMKELTGAASSARLAHAILAQLHGAKAGDMAQDAFPPPPGRVEVEIAAARASGDAATLREWATPQEAATLQIALARNDAGGVTSTDLSSTGLSSTGLSSTSLASTEPQPALAIATPEHNSHIWRNPEQPASQQLLALKLAPNSGAEQILWTIDDAPFIVADAAQTVYWPLTPGVHRIKARDAINGTTARAVKISVE
jgi:penicillin-binding protein 1C